MLVLQSLISSGDHVVSMYPTYGALLEIPKMLGAEMSYWRLKEDDGWKGSLDELKSLLKPSTRLLILNNPHNPTGSVLSTAQQMDILKIAKEHNVIVHSDEIFRPLFHTGEVPTSILEHDFYDRTIATGSLSKAWCFSGIRIGWCVSRNRELRDAMIGLRQWTLQSTGMVDEIIGSETAYIDLRLLTGKCQSRCNHGRPFRSVLTLVRPVLYTAIPSICISDDSKGDAVSRRHHRRQLGLAAFEQSIGRGGKAKMACPQSPANRC